MEGHERGGADRWSTMEVEDEDDLEASPQHGHKKHPRHHQPQRRNLFGLRARDIGKPAGQPVFVVPDESKAPAYLSPLAVNARRLEALWREYEEKRSAEILVQLTDQTSRLTSALMKTAEITERNLGSREAANAQLAPYTEIVGASQMYLAEIMLDNDIQEKAVQSLADAARAACQRAEATHGAKLEAVEEAREAANHALQDIRVFSRFRANYLSEAQRRRLRDAEQDAIAAHVSAGGGGGGPGPPSTSAASPSLRRIPGPASSFASRGRGATGEEREAMRREAKGRSRGEVGAAGVPLEAVRHVKVAGDGRSLFRAALRGRAIADGFELTRRIEKEEADRARQLVALAMTQQQSELVSLGLVAGDFQAHLARLRERGAAGGQPEALLLAHVVEAPLHVHLRGADCYVRVEEYGAAYGAVRGPIRLLYTGHEHYDLLADPAQYERARQTAKRGEKCSLM